jgi:hypothetical protein
MNNLEEAIEASNHLWVPSGLRKPQLLKVQRAVAKKQSDACQSTIMVRTWTAVAFGFPHMPHPTPAMKVVRTITVEYTH